MDYKSSYDHKEKTTVLTVKASSMIGAFLIVFGLIVLVVSAFWIVKGVQYDDWGFASIGSLCGVVSICLLALGVNLFFRKTTFTISNDSLSVDHTGKPQKLKNFTIDCADIISIEKSFDEVNVGKGQNMDYNPIYLYTFEGEEMEVMKIVGDVKMADEIIRFIRKRSGLLDR